MFWKMRPVWVFLPRAAWQLVIPSRADGTAPMGGAPTSHAVNHLRATWGVTFEVGGLLSR